MRKLFYTLAFVAFALSTATVYGEGAKVPASTTAIEKAVKTTSVELPANTNGANITPLTHIDINGYNVEILGLKVIHWVADEEFYLNGYKALLSKEVTSIFVPPNS